MENGIIKTVEQLQSEVNELKKREGKMCGQRAELTQNINRCRKQILLLEERILNNTQYEMFNK